MTSLWVWSISKLVLKSFNIINYKVLKYISKSILSLMPYGVIVNILGITVEPVDSLGQPVPTKLIDGLLIH